MGSYSIDFATCSGLAQGFLLGRDCFSCAIDGKSIGSYSIDFNPQPSNSVAADVSMPAIPLRPRNANAGVTNAEVLQSRMFQKITASKPVVFGISPIFPFMQYGQYFNGASFRENFIDHNVG